VDLFDRVKIGTPVKVLAAKDYTAAN
jgi:hypothetical protein